jgi:hypothetical protein
MRFQIFGATVHQAIRDMAANLSRNLITFFAGVMTKRGGRPAACHFQQYHTLF